MSVQAFERVESIEHLAFRPSCQGCCHKSDPPPAQFWFDIHGCVGKFACAACVESDRAWIQMVGGLHCRHCRRDFATFDAAAKVVPL
jgi:hypothetical protein